MGLLPTMAADKSLLQLEEIIDDDNADVAAAARVCCNTSTDSGNSSSSSSSKSNDPPARLTEAEARSAAIAAAAKADALSERCRSLLPLLKSAVEGSSCNNKSSSKETCNKDKANGGLLDFESDDEGPVVELGK